MLIDVVTDLIPQTIQGFIFLPRFNPLTKGSALLARTFPARNIYLVADDLLPLQQVLRAKGRVSVQSDQLFLNMGAAKYSWGLKIQPISSMNY